MGSKRCSYCGIRPAPEREHVFPRNLYPASKASSRVQRLTIPACKECNNGWSDDEVHFRNILALAGEPNKPRRELWDGPVHRGLFEQPDGYRRISDLLDRLHSVVVDGKPRHKVYPGNDPRIVRVVKKIVRGLSHYHGVETAIPESRVWADVQKFQIQEEFLPEMAYHHREADIAEYRYAVLETQGIASAWLITLFEKVTFLGIVSLSNEALSEMEDGG